MLCFILGYNFGEKIDSNVPKSTLVNSTLIDKRSVLKENISIKFSGFFVNNCFADFPQVNFARTFI